MVMTDEEIIRAAFQALLRGDYAERDRLLVPLLERERAREKMRSTAEKMVDYSDRINVKEIPVKQPLTSNRRVKCF